LYLGLRMLRLIRPVFNIFNPATPVPLEYRSNFIHLYFDIAWFGIVSGTTLAFLAVFATRQGALPTQIGLLSAVPALVNLLFALPAGSWLSKLPVGKAVFWSSILTRVFYLVFIPLPVLFAPAVQVWWIILITLVMTIPATLQVVGFNALFAEVVPVEWRGHVAGIRNAILSIVATVFTLLSGLLLDRVVFPLGYQIVFGLGFIGAVLSSLHLYLIARNLRNRQNAPAVNGDRAARQRTAQGRRLMFEISQLYRWGMQSMRLDVMRGHFARIMGLLFFWHLVQFLTIPAVTPFIVNDLGISDQLIGLATGLFNITMFLGSIGLSRATQWLGNKRLVGAGFALLSLFPILTAFGTVPYILANIAGGLAWAMAGGALFNYLFENMPENDRPAYLAWYILVSNAAILIGSLAGPPIAQLIGFSTALIIFGFGRLLAGLALLRWG
jgi:MFS family permease